jgi:hypothetical protein
LSKRGSKHAPNWKGKTKMPDNWQARPAWEK